MARRTPEERKRLADEVVNLMASGSAMSSNDACRMAGVPHSRFMAWCGEDAELADRYARAREDLIERIANEVIELSDADVGLQPDGKKDWAAVQKHKLQVDTRKWLLSKLAPKKYGDKLELTGDPDRPLAIQKIERVVVK